MVNNQSDQNTAHINLGCCFCCRNTCGVNTVLCSYCLSELPAMREQCLRCGQATAQQLALCGRCQRIPPSFDTVIAAYHYQTPIKDMIFAIKHAKQLALLKPLVPFLADKIRAHYQDKAMPTLLVPVPLHPLRYWLRGYNQAFQLAQAIQALLPTGCVSIKEVARRTSYTKKQRYLSKGQRTHNVKGVFRIKEKVDEHVAIVDDVVTTGATCEALAKALKKCGASTVDVWSLARA